MYRRTILHTGKLYSVNANNLEINFWLPFRKVTFILKSQDDLAPNSAAAAAEKVRRRHQPNFRRRASRIWSQPAGKVTAARLRGLPQKTGAYAVHLRTLAVTFITCC